RPAGGAGGNRLRRLALRPSRRHAPRPAARDGERRDPRALPHAHPAWRPAARRLPRLRFLRDRRRARRGGRSPRPDEGQAMTDAANRDFWLSSGHVLLDRREDGGLVATDAFLKAYLARPELMPPEEACPAERALHARLMDDPFAAVSPVTLAQLADADARDNWRAFLSFRDRLLAAPTLQDRMSVV